MSSPSSSTLDEVVDNIMEDVLRERVEQIKNQEIVLVEKVREEIEEVEVKAGEARVFLSNKGAEAFKKSLAKKGFVEERGFRELVTPFKEEVERRGLGVVCKPLELGIRALVKEFYGNLGERKNMTFYVKRRWVPFEERAISHCLDSKKGDTASIMSSSRKTLTSKRSLESSWVAKGNWRE